MTATTIGLGDIAPQTQPGRLFAIFHMCLSVVMFAAVVGTILSALERRRTEYRKRELLGQQLDEQVLGSLDRDGDGVDRAEFVLGMLELLEVVGKDDYIPFLKQFDAFDRTGDGKLRRDDLVLMAQENRSRWIAAHEAPKNARQLEVDGLRTCGLRLLLPTGLMCFSFVWNSVFGYVLVVGGLTSGLAIGIGIGTAPTARAFLLAAVLSMLSALLVAVGIAYMFIFISSPAEYLEIDPLMKSTSYAVLSSETNLLVEVQGCSAIRIFRAAMDLMVKTDACKLTFALYIGFWLLTIAGHIHFTLVCIRASVRRTAAHQVRV